MKKNLPLAFSFFLASLLNAQIITTVVGNGQGAVSGNGGQALAAAVDNPTGISFDALGNMYIATTTLRKVTTAGIITSIAGTGTNGFSGDGGPATAAKFYGIQDAVVDAAGNIFIADDNNYRIRKVDPQGIITTYAGIGIQGFSGDGGPASAAKLSGITDLAFDAAGNLYLADYANSRVRKITTAGIISTIAGNGTPGYTGDGGTAIAAELNGPSALAFDALGNLYITDINNNCIRMVNTAGIISTVAGIGVAGYSGDGGPATAAKLYSPGAIVLDPTGNLYITEFQNDRIRMVNTAGIISTFAGTGVIGFSGDGGPAIAAKFRNPEGITIDAANNLYIADSYNNRIRKISLPLVVTANSATICAGSVTTLTATGAVTYYWAPATGLSATTGANVVANPMVTTIYTVTGVGAFGTTTATATSTITVNGSTISVNTPTICAGAIATLSASGASSYTWSTGATGPTLTISPTSTTNYSVAGVNAMGCTNTITTSVVVNPLPAAFTVNSATICAGNTTTLTVNTGGGLNPIAPVSGRTIGPGNPPNVYVWSPATGLNTNTGTSVVASPASTTVYTITITNSNGCTTTATATVTVNQTITSISPTQTICLGASATLTASGTGIVTWSPVASLNSATGSSVVATPTTSTIYSASITNSTGCVGTLTTAVIVKLKPEIRYSSVAANVEENGFYSSVTGNSYIWNIYTAMYPSISFSGQGTNTISNVAWYGQFSPQSTLQTISLNVDGCTSYLYLPAGGHPCPVALFSIDGATTVAPNSVQTYTIDHGTMTLLPGMNWVCDGGTIIGGQGTSIVTIQWGNGYMGSIGYEAINGTTSGQNAALNVTICAAAPPANCFSTSYVNLCTNTSSTLNAANAGSTYVWSTGATTQTIPIANNGSGLYDFYYVTVTNSNGCKTSFVEPVYNNLSCRTMSEETINNTVANTIFYPNPASNTITIQSASDNAIGHIGIYNLLGELVFESICAENTTQLDISNLANGAYTIYTRGLRSKLIKE